MIKNFGVSFGQNVPGLLLVNGLLLILLLGWWGKTKNWRILLIIAGGGLNFWERWRVGYITDYWKIPGINLYNNLNDWLIFLGAGLCIWQLWRRKI